MTCARREAGARRPALSTSASSTPAEYPHRPETRPGRARARFSLLPVLAPLLGALSLFAAAPVQAQTDVWSGTLTAKPVLFGPIVGCDNGEAGAECSTSTVLTDDDFTYNGQTYTIELISLTQADEDGQGLTIVFTASAASLVAADLTLKVGSNEYDLSDANNSTSTNLQWANPGLNWKTDDTVSLQLIDKERLTGLEIKYGDQRLGIGPYGELGPSDDRRPRYVQASPTMKSVTLTPTWGSANIVTVIAGVYYYMPGTDGETFIWLDDESGNSWTLPLYSPLGTPGYPRVTLVVDTTSGRQHTYKIYFQNNGRWEFHNNNLLRRLGLTVPQGQ